MKYKKICVAGGGVLGSQLAFQMAYTGYDVTVWLCDEMYVIETKDRLKVLKDTYNDAIKEMKKGGLWCFGISSKEDFDEKECLAKVKEAYNGIKLETDLAKCLDGCDLLVESIPELKEVKMEFFHKVSDLIDDKTVVVTNSSTMLPSTFAKETGVPERFLALHFANTIWKNNTAEVMSHEETDPKHFKDVIKFAESINMIPLPIVKEKSGYLLNSMLVPFLLSGLDLLANGISDVESIDNAWTMGTGAPKGPFRIIDTVGLKTALNIVDQYQKVPNLFDPLLRKMMMPYNFDGMKAILEKYIKAGKLGTQVGEGFYKYDKKVD